MLKLFSTIKVLFFPEICICCGRKLLNGESVLCTYCLIDAPYTYDWRCLENSTFEKICDRTLIESAAAFLYYRKGSDYVKIAQSIKFHHKKDEALYIGELLGSVMNRESNIFKGVDMLIPTPLHPLRELYRGYNQSTLIAKGISKSVDIPVMENLVKRVRYRKAQVKTKSINERWHNAESMFKVADVKALEGKHIAIVDDVITTGATLVSLIETIKSSVTDIKISVIALSTTEKNIMRTTNKRSSR